MIGKSIGWALRTCHLRWEADTEREEVVVADAGIREGDQGGGVPTGAAEGFSQKREGEDEEGDEGDDDGELPGSWSIQAQRWRYRCGDGAQGRHGEHPQERDARIPHDLLRQPHASM